MTPASKQIVIDKSAFVAFMGREFDALCDFAGSHLLLLSDTLLYECATATRQAPEDLLCRYEDLVRAGAYYCSMSRTFVEWECRHCQPYSWLLADLDETNNIRNGKRRIGDLLTPEITGRAHDRQYHLAEVMLLRQSKEVMEQAGSDLAEEFRVFPADAVSRLKKILTEMSTEMSFDIRDWAITYYARWIPDPVKFRPSHKWMTWQEIRLTKAIFVEYAYLRQRGGVPSDKRAEHDYQDMEYVLLLSRADGIITRDKRLVEPLARAAFPEKDVFSSLEEVPESYRCDWANE